MKWQTAKRHRMKEVGKRCEHCGYCPTKRHPLIGHHVIPKHILKMEWEPLLRTAYGSEWSQKYDEFFHITDLIRIRCTMCERDFHLNNKWGNTKTDNVFVVRYLTKLTGIVGEQMGRR